MLNEPKAKVSPIDIEAIQRLCDPYDNCQTECDGQTLILNTVLNRANIPHTVYGGSFEWDGIPFMVHCWIALPNGYLIDYRVRLWYVSCVDDVNVLPHGVFDPNEYPLARYDGQPTNDIDAMPSDLFDMLTGFRREP